MHKKYIVRLSDEERGVLAEVVGKLKGGGQKVRRAQMLLKADADGLAWTDSKIAEADVIHEMPFIVHDVELVHRFALMFLSAQVGKNFRDRPTLFDGHIFRRHAAADGMRRITQKLRGDLAFFRFEEREQFLCSSGR